MSARLAAIERGNVAELAVAGGLYRDWLSLQVRCEWDAPVREFAFTTGGSGARGIDTGQSAIVRLNGQQIIKGMINCRAPSYDKDHWHVVLQGMSVTSPIVRSSVPIGPDYRNTSFSQLARTLLKPHGVELKLDNPPPGLDRPFRRIVIRPGETVFAVLERLGRLRGVIFGDDHEGNLVVRQHMGDSAAPVADLVEGQNILAAQGAFRDDVVFSEYKAVGQIRGDDDFWPPRDPAATRTDDQAPKGTRKVIVTEHGADRQDVRTRVDMEAARATWTSVNVVVVVQGWDRPGTRELWQPTDHVTVRSPMLFNRDDAQTLGARVVTFAQDARRGSTTTLELVLPQYLSARKSSGVSGPQGDLLNPQENPARADPPDTQPQGQAQYPPGGP